MGLIKFLTNYHQEDNVRADLKVPLVITESDNTWLITSVGVNQQESSSQHEADTKIDLFATQSLVPVVEVAADTDILILLIYAYLKMQNGKRMAYENKS